jgi:DNA-binding XRE family transcriptional regulator
MPRRVYPNLATYFRDNPHDSATDVAKDVDCSMAHLSMIKWGTRQPALPLALRIARRCNVPLESLLTPSQKLAGARS